MLGIQYRGMPTDIILIEYGAGERDRLSQLRGCHCGEVGCFIRIEPAEPYDVQATAGPGRRFLVEPKLHGQGLNRCMVGVSPRHLGGVAVQPRPAAVESSDRVLEGGIVLEGRYVAAQDFPGASPGRQRRIFVPDDEEIEL